MARAALDGACEEFRERTSSIVSVNTFDKMIPFVDTRKAPPLFMRVSGASHRLNSRQNDKHAKKVKNGAASAAEKDGRGSQRSGPKAPHLAAVSS